MKVINLLPKALQKEIFYQDRLRLVVFFFTVSVITLGVTYLGLIGARLYLDQQSKKIDAQITQLKSAVSKQENAEIKTQISVINNQIADFQDLNLSTPTWSKVLTAFSKLVPPNVSVNSFVAVNTTSPVTVTGLARTREDVIALYNNLVKDTAHFANVDYPLENVAKPTNVRFRFSFDILPETLLHE